MNDDLELIKFVANKNKILLVEPKRFPSGIINRVYDLGKFVIKIEGSDETSYAKGVLKPQAAIIEKLLARGARIPKILDSDERYLLMEKAQGKNLVYDWLKLDMKQKETILAQVCEQLQIFHSLKFDYYSLPIYLNNKFENLKDAIQNVLNFNLINKTKLQPQYLEDVEFLEDFFRKNVNLLDETNTAVLVHSDMHLENIFHNEDQLTAIIDFDWITAAPPDYELWKITDVFYDPKKTVEKDLKPLYEGYRMTEEFRFIKKHYPELFRHEHLLTRVRLFILEDLIYKIEDFQKGKWSENMMIKLHQQIQDFFKGNWLTDLLS